MLPQKCLIHLSFIVLENFSPSSVSTSDEIQAALSLESLLQGWTKAGGEKSWAAAASFSRTLQMA